MFRLLILLPVLFFSQLVRCQIPASIPLVIRSPYFNSWLPTTNGVSLNGVWPQFWNKRVFAWSGFVRVDGQTFQWMGINNITEVANATTLSHYITPTRSIFTIAAGPLRFNATFLNPIDPSDWGRHSFPFAYLYIDAYESDTSHEVQFHSHTYNLWLSRTAEKEIQWTTFETNSSVYHTASRTNIQPMVDRGDMAEDSRVYYAMTKDQSLTWQVGFSDNVTTQFATNGFLSDTDDPHFRAISDADPVLGLSVDLGTIKQLVKPIVWAIGLVREPNILDTTSSTGPQNRSTYFMSQPQYRNMDDAIDLFLADFPNAYTRANDLDTKILSEASSISPTYADLVSLGFRQAIGSIELTTNTDGYDPNDIKVYMKDIGISGRVNPVDTIYATLPALLYFNASIVGPLLEPLFDYQFSSTFPSPFAVPDLGISYPNVLGNNSNTALEALESCSSMLIMGCAHALKTGDRSVVSKYYPLLSSWSDYLVKNTLHPIAYRSDDGLTFPDMSNMAVKGIIAISAMEIITAMLMKPQADIDKYQISATSLASQWEGLAISSGHIKSTYDDNTTWVLAYDLYAAHLIGSQVIKTKVFDDQTTFYASQISSSPPFGLPYDSHNPLQVKSQWLLFTAATATNESTRDALISMAHSHAFSNTSDLPFPEFYSGQSGATFMASGPSAPVQGSMYSLLALSIPNQEIPGPGSTAVSSNKTSTVGPVVGGVAGLILGLILIALFIWRRRNLRQKVHQVSNTVLPFIHATDTAPEFLPQINATIGRRDQKGYIRDISNRVLTDQLSLKGQARPSSIPSGSISSPSVSGSQQQDLVDEVHRLRQEMNNLRAGRATEDPPPLYVEETR